MTDSGERGRGAQRSPREERLRELDRALGSVERILEEEVSAGGLAATQMFAMGLKSVTELRRSASLAVRELRLLDGEGITRPDAWS